MPTGFNNTPPIGQNIANNIASNVTGIISTRAQAKYASGARCLLKVNGRLVGFAFGISWRITTAVTEIRTIDNYLPYELAPQMITVDGSISALHIPGQSAGTLIWQPDVLNFLSQQYISIEARDSTTDQLLFFTAEAMITSRTEDIRVDQLANVTLTFKAIGYRDERSPATPDNLNDIEKGPTRPSSGLVSDTPQLNQQLQQIGLPRNTGSPDVNQNGIVPGEILPA